MKIIKLEGDVGFEITANALRGELPDSGEDVTIDVCSYGGSILEGMELFNTIKDYPGHVTARIGAIGASAASYFPLSADKVVVRSNSTMMIHCGWTVTMGNAEEMRKTADVMAGLDGLIAQIYANKTGKDKKEILKDMSNEKWLSGWEAIVDYGLADEMDEPTQEPTDPLEPNESIAKVESVKNRMKASGTFKDDIERAAAMLHKTGSVCYNNQVKTGVTGKNKPKEGEMSFENLMASNPEAKAEYENLIQTAVAEGKAEGIAEGMATAKTEESSRVAEILDLCGAVISDDAKTAIKDGLDPGEYAKAALKNGVANIASAGNAAKLAGVNNAKEPKEDLPVEGNNTAAFAKSLADSMIKSKNKRR